MTHKITQNPVSITWHFWAIKSLIHWSILSRYLNSQVCQAVDEFWHMIHHTCGKLMHGG